MRTQNHCCEMNHKHACMVNKITRSRFYTKMQRSKPALAKGRILIRIITREHVVCRTSDNQAAPWMYNRVMHLPWPKSLLRTEQLF